MDDSMFTMCVLILVSWTIYGCDGYILRVVNSSCEEDGVMHDMSPLTLSSIYDNNDSIGAANHLLENGDQVRVSGHADFLPPFVYYGCYHHKLTFLSERVFSDFFDNCRWYDIEPTRPLYDCFQNCYKYYKRKFYMGLGFNSCLCTGKASILRVFRVKHSRCVHSFKDIFRKQYNASNPNNIVIFKVGKSSVNLLRARSPKSEPYLMLSSFAVFNNTGRVEKIEYGFSCGYDNINSTDILATLPNPSYVISKSGVVYNITDSQYSCLDYLMFLATRQIIGIFPSNKEYSNEVVLLGDFTYLSIYDSKPIHDDSCVMLEMENGRLFVKADNCSVQRPFLCKGEIGNASNEEENWSSNNVTIISYGSYPTGGYIKSAYNETDTRIGTMLNDNLDWSDNNKTSNNHESNLNDENVGFANSVTSTSKGSATNSDETLFTNNVISTSNIIATNDKEVRFANYIVPVVVLCVACSILVGIFLLYRPIRSNKLCCSCNKASKPTIALNHSTSINVPGRTTGHTNSGSVCVPGRTAGNVNNGSVCVQGRTAGNVNNGSVCVPGRIARNIITGCTCAARNVQGTTTTDCVHCRLISTARNRAEECLSSDGAVPGCNNIGKYCVETPAIEPEEIEELTADQ